MIAQDNLELKNPGSYYVKLFNFFWLSLMTFSKELVAICF